MRYHDDATNVPPKISGTQALPRTPRTSTPFLRTTPGTQSVWAAGSAWHRRLAATLRPPRLLPL